MTSNENGNNIKTSITNNILTIILDRPQKKNAISSRMYKDMAEALAMAADDAAVRVILIRGTDNCFTSGNDLMDFIAFAQGSQESLASEFLINISSAKKPIVAAVSGPAIGIGTTLLLHCDLVYASESATFCLPFVNLGLCPEAACSYLLPKLAGYQKAAELLFLGEAFSAHQAAAVGLVNGVYADDVLYETVWRKARQLAEQPPASLLLTKSLLKRAYAAQIADTMQTELVEFAKRLKSDEAREAFTAFFEGRKPDFSKTASS